MRNYNSVCKNMFFSDMMYNIFGDLSLTIY